MLFMGCWAGSETPAVWVWKRKRPSALIPGAEAVFHQAIPDLARGSVLGDLFEKVVVRVEEEAEARAELVDVQATAARPLDVLDAIINREREFLKGGRTGFTDVVSADGNGVETRREARSEFESVDDQAHRGRGGIDVFLLRDVFLQDVVLDGAGNLLPVGSLLFRDHQIHGPQDRGG